MASVKLFPIKALSTFTTPPNNRARPALVQRTTISPAKERARHAPTKNQSWVPKWKNTTTLPIVFFVANFPSTFVKTQLPNASNANWGFTATVNPAVNAKRVRSTPVYYNDNDDVLLIRF